MPEEIWLKVTIPNIPFDQIRGTLVTRMGRSGYLRLDKVADNTAVAKHQDDLHTHPDT
ncbi:MAG TPA: hypothetical protein QGF35_05370 [Dehalococcoidia bacterium]|nr:hypothetical protein [Dehalococcoidia bacterium]